MVSHRRFKDSVYEQLGRIGKATASPKRLELLDLLGQGPRSVAVLATQAAISVANTSQHLQLLRAARLVEADKKGLHIEYRLAGDEVWRFCAALRGLAETKFPELERLIHDRVPPMEPLAKEELLRRVRRGEVLVVDVRPTEEFAAGHVPGALSIPLDQLRARLGQLPEGREIVAYCRGRYCVMALEAVALLQKAGRNAHRMEEGVMEWRARGWRVETDGARP